MKLNILRSKIFGAPESSILGCPGRVLGFIGVKDENCSQITCQECWSREIEIDYKVLDAIKNKAINMMKFICDSCESCDNCPLLESCKNGKSVTDLLYIERKNEDEND